VGADAAVAVTVERCGVAAGAAVAFARDEIDERGILDLLHLSLTPTVPAYDDPPPDQGSPGGGRRERERSIGWSIGV
jgi:hypothetical protein